MMQQQTIDSVTRDEFKERIHKQFGDMANPITQLGKDLETVFAFSNQNELPYSSNSFKKVLELESVKKRREEFPILIQSLIGYQGHDFYEAAKFLAPKKDEVLFKDLTHSIINNTAKYDGKTLSHPHKNIKITFGNDYITLEHESNNIKELINYKNDNFMYPEVSRFKGTVSELKSKPIKGYLNRLRENVVYHLF